MRKAAVFLIAVFAMMLALAAIVGQSLVLMQRIAHVSSAKGHVELMKARTAEFVPLGPREYVKAGDTIRTGGDCCSITRICTGEVCERSRTSSLM